MSRVDSGNESQEGSPDTTVSEPPFPPRFSAALTQGKTVIRPVAFKPSALSNTRFSNSGHRYGSTPILARPASHLALYGSSGELWRERKVVSPPPAMSSLPSDCSRLHSYDSLDSVYKSATNTNSNRKVVSPPPALPSDSSRLLLSFDSQDSVDDKLDSYSTDDSRKLISPPQPAPPSDASRHRFFTSVDSSFKPPPKSKLIQRRVQSPPPSLPSDNARLLYYGSVDSGYKSTNSNSSRLIRRAPPLSSLPQGFGRLQSFSSLDSVCTLGSNPKTADSRGASCDLSPSPCDSSTLAELEVALRERDSELLYLRQTMETNEQVIFRVYEEKERAWERELRRVRAAAEERLRSASQRSSKTERTLITHTYQLQQEKKRLREEIERAKEENSSLRGEIEALRSRLEETEWGLCQKSGELALVKAKLKEAQGEHATKGHETLSLRNELKETRAILEKRNLEVERLRTDVEKISDKFEKEQSPKEKLVIKQDEDFEKSEFERLRETLDRERAEWEAEREKWSSEKERVLTYQKQLQVNYVAMYRRTRELEKARSLAPEITSGIQL